MIAATKPITYTAQIEAMNIKDVLAFPFADKDSIRVMISGSIKDKHPNRVYKSFVNSEDFFVLRLK